jgi:hypothetical protein
MTMEVVGYFFDVGTSTVCRIITWMEPLLAGLTRISKNLYLTPEKVKQLMIDAPETPIERPQCEQRAFYSVKKKQHTIKTEIRVTSSGCILHVSRSVLGSVYDFRIFKEGEMPAPNVRIIADAGYQGIHNVHANCIHIVRKNKSDSPILCMIKGIFNMMVARQRVKVE